MSVQVYAKHLYPVQSKFFYNMLQCQPTWCLRNSTPVCYISTRAMSSIYNPCAVFVLLQHVTVPAYLFHAPSVLLRLSSSTWCQCYSTSGSPTPTCGLFFLHLQLPNTSLNGGNVCLATLHSSDRDLQLFYYVYTHQTETDRDLQPFYYVYMNTLVRLSLLPSPKSTYFANIFNAVNEHPCLPSFQQKSFQDCILSPFYYLRLPSDHFVNIFVTTLTEQSL
jgi:hypothetical protein